MAKKQIRTATKASSTALRKRKPTYRVIEFRVAAFIATLTLAAIAILIQERDPVIWSFLTTAIGFALGRALR